MRFNNRTNFSLSFFMLMSMVTAAQANWKNWNGIGVDLDLSKKFSIGLSHLRAYDIDNNFQNYFNQSSISTEYGFSRKIKTKLGFGLNRFPGDALSDKKFFGRITYRLGLGEMVQWSNGIQGEMHVAKGTSYRIIYMTRLAPIHRISFLKLSPSVSYWLFYNIGGNAIQYFDESGSPLAKQTPDGLHRGRFILNLNSKISKHLSLSLYYMNQHEFNLAGNDINVVNPRTGKVARPFKNYQVAGSTLSFSFDLFKKNNSHKK